MTGASWVDNEKSMNIVPITCKIKENSKFQQTNAKSGQKPNLQSDFHNYEIDKEHTLYFGI